MASSPAEAISSSPFKALLPLTCTVYVMLSVEEKSLQPSVFAFPVVDCV